MGKPAATDRPRLPSLSHSFTLDFVVLCNGTRTEAQQVKDELGTFLETLGLKLSEEKTKITHITEGFDFLGYKVIKCRGTSGTMVPKVLVPAKAITQFRHKIRRMLAPNTTNESMSTKILVLNRLIRGWCEYYRSTSSPHWVFNKVEGEIYWQFAHWLGRKYKASMPAIMQKYKKGHTFGTNAITLVMPTEYKAKRFLAKTWHNPYTAKEAIRREKLLSYVNLWNGHEDRQGWSDLREEVILLKGTTCYVCGTTLHPSEVEIDHVIPRARFKDPKEADRMKHLQPINWLRVLLIGVTS
jgi:RNA-directed DNA polymerase